MKRLVLSIVALWLLAPLAGCRGANESNTVGAKRLIVNVPESQTVRPGGTEKLTVAITRVGLDSPVRLDVVGLPPGVQVLEKEVIIGRDSQSGTFTLQADVRAAPAENHVVTLTATAEGHTTVAESFRLNVARAD